MATEVPLVVPLHQHIAHVHTPPVETPGADVPAPTAEQARAADGVFASKRESDIVIGLIGMQAGILLLHDLAVEHLGPRADEDEKKKPSAPPDPEGDAR